MGINEFSDGGKNELDHTILNLVKTFNVNIILKPIDIGNHIPFVILHAQLKIMLKVKLNYLYLHNIIHVRLIMLPMSFYTIALIRSCYL